jgi:hypothetical protein
MSEFSKTDPPLRSARAARACRSTSPSSWKARAKRRPSPFHVTAEAVRVSRGGATLITDIPARRRMRVRLTPPFGRALDAEVNGVWTDEADGRQRIGVKLLDPNGWFAE